MSARRNLLATAGIFLLAVAANMALLTAIGLGADTTIELTIAAALATLGLLALLVVLRAPSRYDRRADAYERARWDALTRYAETGDRAAFDTEYADVNAALRPHNYGGEPHP